MVLSGLPESYLQIKLVSEPIDPAAYRSFLERTSCGAVVEFRGTVRDWNRDRRVTAIEYEGYADMALPMMSLIAYEAVDRHHLKQAVVVHRLGRVAAGEIGVFVGVTAPHRHEAFDACREIIDRLKKDVTLWKKEIYEDGSDWIANHP